MIKLSSSFEQLHSLSEMLERARQFQYQEGAELVAGEIRLLAFIMETDVDFMGGALRTPRK